MQVTETAIPGVLIFTPRVFGDARGAMAGLMAEVVEDHIRTHLVDDQKHPGALNGEAAEQLLDVIRTYLK